MSNSFEKFEDQICAQEKTVRQEMEKLFVLHKSRPPATVQDYTFETATAPVKLSELFGNKNELVLIHNMGKQCVYCTLWADGFNGFAGHLENRAGFVLINNDSVEEQTAFAASRGWKFKTASAKGTSFSKDMGFLGENGKEPGISVYTKLKDGTIQHRTRAEFGPGDVFCSIWSIFDLLPTAQPGAEDWSPKYSYDQKQNEAFRFSANVALNVRDITGADHEGEMMEDPFGMKFHLYKAKPKTTSQPEKLV